MKRLLALLACIPVLAYAAPSPRPLTVNSRAQQLPAQTVYRASEIQFDLTFVDGTSASDITGHTVWMAWATNDTASAVSTASVTILTATSGTARARFTSAAINYPAGRYLYEVGTASGGVTFVVRQGVWVIEGSPYATGADPVTWTSNLNLSTVTLLGTVPLANLSGITSNQMAAATVTAFLAGDGAGGATDHAALTNIGWTASGHTGTAARLAGFFEGGAAGYSGPGAGLYFDGEDKLAISNAVLTAAALWGIDKAGVTGDVATAAANAASATTTAATALSAAQAAQGTANDATQRVAEIEVTYGSVAAWAANGETAYGWGDHGSNGYLTVETDPVYRTDKAGLAHFRQLPGVDTNLIGFYRLGTNASGYAGDVPCVYTNSGTSINGYPIYYGPETMFFSASLGCYVISDTYTSGLEHYGKADAYTNSPVGQWVALFAENQPCMAHYAITLIATNPGVTVRGIAPSNLVQAGASAGQVLAWDGAVWAPAAGGGGSNYLVEAGTYVDSVETNYDADGIHFTVNAAEQGGGESGTMPVPYQMPYSLPGTWLDGSDDLVKNRDLNSEAIDVVSEPPLTVWYGMETVETDEQDGARGGYLTFPMSGSYTQMTTRHWANGTNDWLTIELGTGTHSVTVTNVPGTAMSVVTNVHDVSAWGTNVSAGTLNWITVGYHVRDEYASPITNGLIAILGYLELQ